MRIGVIADDVTGASDIAGFLAAGGLKTIMYNGVPTKAPPVHIDAVVVSLKIRSCPVETAVGEALASLAFLRQWGCTEYYYKYCSTFDSTTEGNIGPVVDALGLETCLIGDQIDPGVSWLKDGESDLQVAYKSGNFGSTDFFETAQLMCREVQGCR